MFELFEVGDVLATPKGLVLGGTSNDLDSLPENELTTLLSDVKTIDVAMSDNSRLSGIRVSDYSITTSVGNRRNIFLLVGDEIPQGSVLAGAIVYCNEGDLGSELH